jgi:hypothetical protein
VFVSASAPLIDTVFILSRVGNTGGGLKRNKIPIVLQVQQSKRRQRVRVKAAS